MGGFIKQSSIDEVSNRTDIVSLINEYVPLTQQGSDFTACCPFHNEKTPSFHVSPEKKFYYCFGCGNGGNVFKFVMEMEKITFPAAIEFLAKKAGIQLSYEDSGSERQREDPNQKLKEELVELYNRTAGLFHYALMQTEAGKFALDYILQRGLTRETLEKFKIGYSPADRKWLRNFLTKKNFSQEFLDKSGLFSKKYPEIAFFSDRLMFPIFDRKGDCVAMGGRFLRGNPENSPKYINSGELIQYKKGSTLYAFNFAKQTIREKRAVIFCEGYMDCIAYHQCGITNAVAPLGTALTDEQIVMVKPFVDTVLLSFDSDGAGQKATKRAILMCRRHNITVKVIQLSGGKDPAEIMINFGAEVLTNEVDRAILDNDYLLSKLRELYPSKNPEGKMKASLDFFSYLDVLQSDVQREACLEQMCQAFEIDPEAAKRDYSNRENLSRRIERIVPADQNVQGRQEKLRLTSELRAVLTTVSDDPKYFQMMREQFSSEDLDDPQARELFSINEECLKGGIFSVSNILNRCSTDEFRNLVIQSISEYSSNVEKSVTDSINLVRRNILDKKSRNILEEIRRLERSKLDDDQIRLKELLSNKIEIDRQIALLKG